jgi:hypothetical protein
MDKVIRPELNGELAKPAAGPATGAVKISKKVRKELIAALKRTGTPAETLALARRIDELSALCQALAIHDVTANVLAVLDGYGKTLTEGEVVEALRSYPASNATPAVG